MLRGHVGALVVTPARELLGRAVLAPRARVATGLLVAVGEIERHADGRREPLALRELRARRRPLPGTSQLHASLNNASACAAASPGVGAPAAAQRARPRRRRLREQAWDSFASSELAGGDAPGPRPRARRAGRAARDGWAEAGRCGARGAERAGELAGRRGDRRTGSTTTFDLRGERVGGRPTGFGFRRRRASAAGLIAVMAGGGVAAGRRASELARPAVAAVRGRAPSCTRGAVRNPMRGPPRPQRARFPRSLGCPDGVFSRPFGPPRPSSGRRWRADWCPPWPRCARRGRMGAAAIAWGPGEAGETRGGHPRRGRHRGRRKRAAGVPRRRRREAVGSTAIAAAAD